MRGTTREQVAARLAEAVDRIARPHPGKLQRDLDRIGLCWSPPDHLETCLGGWVHWQIPADPESMLRVSAHHDDPRPAVRLAVVVALGTAIPHVPFAAEALTAGLRDPDYQVRINAARGLAAHPPWAPLRPHLLRALGDPLWTVRWLAAVAVARYGHAETASAVLCATHPDRDDTWRMLAGQVVDPSPALASAVRQSSLRAASMRMP